MEKQVNRLRKFYNDYLRRNAPFFNAEFVMRNVGDINQLRVAN